MAKKTIAELIVCENQRRETPPRTSLCDIFLSDQDGERCLADQKKSLTTIAQKKEVVKLRYISNLSYGGMSETVENNIVHPSYWDLLKKLASLFPALPFLTVDILINVILNF